MSLQGEQKVVFGNGGWCVQRPVGAQPGSEGLLRFWLDCLSGATKGDVSISRGERIFFSTAVFDDAISLAQMAEQRAEVEAGLKDLKERQERRVAGEGGEGGVFAAIPGLAQIASFRDAVADEETRTRLETQAAFFERLPRLGEGPAALAAGTGGLSVKRQMERPAGPLGPLIGERNVYHILGSFEAEPVSLLEG